MSAGAASSASPAAQPEAVVPEVWTPLRTKEPPAGVPIVMRCAGPAQVPMRQWRLATLADFPLIADDPSLTDIPSIL